MHKGDGCAAKPLGKSHFIAKMFGQAMIQPASSDFWKAPYDSLCCWQLLF